MFAKASKRVAREHLIGFNCMRNAILTQRRRNLKLLFKAAYEDERQRELLKLCHASNIKTNEVFGRSSLLRIAAAYDTPLQAVRSNL